MRKFKGIIHFNIDVSAVDEDHAAELIKAATSDININLSANNGYVYSDNILEIITIKEVKNGT